MSPRPRRAGKPRAATPRSRLALAAGSGFALLTLAVIVLGLWAVWTYQGPGPRAKQGQQTTVILERGSGLTRIASTLREAGVIRSPGIFVAAAKASGAASRLKAGEYAVPSHASMASILRDIRDGKVVRHWVTVPEGRTSQMAVDILAAQPVLVGAASAPLEGAILPETYEVQRGEDRAVVMRRMTDAQAELLAALWARRQPGLPFARPQEAVTLASIVEKETAVAAERPRIAAVFLNRLRSGMRLQSDPTIIYGITKGYPLGRGIRQSELQAATPYNTYAIDGLPPTPIANPGRASLEAVLNPLKTTELYFVADGTGGHVFASTLDQHNANVARWRAIERQRGQAPMQGPQP